MSTVEEKLAELLTAETADLVLCYGDSITRGVPGVTYLSFINKKWKLKNYGLGGDTLIGLSNRVFLNMENRRRDSYILQIGTNDILLPYLFNHSELWRDRIAGLIKRGSKPCENEHNFKEEFERLILKFQKQGKKLKIINIPCIGEDLKSTLNTKVDTYNNVLKTLTDEYGIDYIDFNNWQKNMLKDKNNGNNYFISKNPFDVAIDSLLTSFLPVSDCLSRKRGLHITIDGCHLNTLGARGLADLVEERLCKQRM